jgi:hypothetical protein
MPWASKVVQQPKADTFKRSSSSTNCARDFSARFKWATFFDRAEGRCTQDNDEPDICNKGSGQL